MSARASILAISAFCLTPLLFADNPPSEASPERSSLPELRSSTPLRESDRYQEDRISVQVVSGALVSPIGIGPYDDSFNYAPTNIRVGWMLNTPDPQAGIFSGNFEAILELSTSAIFEGSGNILIGPTALVRYNFVQPDSRIVPYLQAGAGFVYTDAYEDRSQRAIGQAIEFTPQASLGLRYHIDEHWSVDTEATFHHISNASLADRNLGINSVGGFIGVSYFFDKLWE